MLRHFIFAFLILFAIVAPAHAGGLWTLEPSVSNQPIDSAQLLTFDREQLHNWQVGKAVPLSLPGHDRVEALLRERSVNPNGSVTLRADLTGSAKAGALILSFDESQIFAHIEYANTTYKLEADGKLGAMRSPKLEHGAEAETLIVAQPRNQARRVAAKAEPGRGVAKADLSPAIYDEEVVELNVLIAYSKTAADNYGGNINTRIAQIKAVTNHYLEASGVFIRVNFVHTVEIDHPEGESNSTLLSRISKAQPPWFGDIHNLRHEHRAAVVAYLSETGGGGSYLCGWNGSVTGCEHTRYIAVALRQAGEPDTLFAHELGHALGLTHSRRQGEVGASFPFALGHLHADGAGTIMSYYTRSLGRYSQSLGESDDGTPLGVPKEYKNGADAVYALNAVRFEVAETYVSSPDLTLAADTLEAHGHMALAQCVRDGKSKYAAIIYDLDCRNKGLTSLAGLELLPNLQRVDLSNNLLSDLSDFPPLQDLEVLNLNHNYITDISSLVHLPSISKMQLVGNQIAQLPDFSPLEEQLDQRTNIKFDLRDNQLHNIESLLESLERRGIALQYRLEGNDSILCWQKRYLLEAHLFVPGEVFDDDFDVTEFQRPEPCDSSDDAQDYNGNGTANMADIEAGVNPFSPAFNNTLSFSQDEYYAEEDSGAASIYIQRSGEDLSGDVEFKLATQYGFVSHLEDGEWVGGNPPAEPYLDYVPVNQSYVIPDGEAGIEVEIELIDDPWYYGRIEFQVRLYASTGAGIASSNTATVNIEDDERHTMEEYDESVAAPVEGGPPLIPSDESSGSSGGGFFGSSLLLLLALAIIGRPRKNWRASASAVLQRD
ncbi:M12 family metallo-peptidase [Marinimicrobium sp. ABcell2]|uniref:M12 family metallo-peptidase n=1 Tax=Marinimicrobium sp. ABcell2 TaxID=3069751 RepID=UPI0027B39098|nr:M12 family metallo-peptidase [Marinimicrobium sp. ABcell2]MDQ2075144.1 M12 family metallo-peptidase [Marinimicrobium sp. ABcell2]